MPKRKTRAIISRTWDSLFDRRNSKKLGTIWTRFCVDRPFVAELGVSSKRQITIFEKVGGADQSAEPLAPLALFALGREARADSILEREEIPIAASESFRIAYEKESLKLSPIYRFTCILHFVPETPRIHVAVLHSLASIGSSDVSPILQSRDDFSPTVAPRVEKGGLAISCDSVQQANI